MTFSFQTENIAHLAETALRFLELVQENNLNTEQDLNGEDVEEALHPNENYDSGKTQSSFYIFTTSLSFVNLSVMHFPQKSIYKHTDIKTNLTWT